MKKNGNQFKIIISRMFLAMMFLYLLSACGPTNKSNIQQDTPTLESTPDLLLEMNNTINVENQNTETAVQTLQLTEPQESEVTNTQVKLNPPHGEPGHRCEIPVGAPLDRPTPNTTVQPVENTSVTPVNSTTNTTIKPSNRRVGPTIENLNSFVPSKPIGSATENAVVLNPPHGQPGHRCDIPVGNPLPVTASNNVKLNPPHGQPGHRCDIPVGSPLPS